MTIKKVDICRTTAEQEGLLAIKYLSNGPYCYLQDSAEYHARKAAHWASLYLRAIHELNWEGK